MTLASVVLDGQGTTISLGGNTLQEVSITPPALNGGGEINVTTHRNSAYRTKAPKKLTELGEVSFSAIYDPAEWNAALSDINNNQQITVTFANGDTLQFYGFVDSFAPAEISEGEIPTVDVTIIVSNQDGADQTGGAESAPVFTSA